MDSQERVNEDVVESNEAIYEAPGGGVTVKRSAKIAFDNDTYASGNQAFEVKCDDRTRSSTHEPAKNLIEVRPKRCADMYGTTSHSSGVNEGFEDLQGRVGKESQEKPSTSKRLEQSDTTNGSADDVVLSSDPVPAAEVKGKSVTAKSCDESISDGTEDQNKINNEEDTSRKVEGNVVVV